MKTQVNIDYKHENGKYVIINREAVAIIEFMELMHTLNMSQIGFSEKTIKEHCKKMRIGAMAFFIQYGIELLRELKAGAIDQTKNEVKRMGFEAIIPQYHYMTIKGFETVSNEGWPVKSQEELDKLFK